MPDISGLPLASAVAGTDWLAINKGGANQDYRAPASLLGLPQTPGGLKVTKASVPHNVQTAAFIVGFTGGTSVTHAHLVALTLVGSGRLATATFLVTVAYSVVSIVKLGEALFSFTAVSMNYFINTTDGSLLLYVTQTNPSSAAVSVTAQVLPLNASADGSITLVAA